MPVFVKSTDPLLKIGKKVSLALNLVDGKRNALEIVKAEAIVQIQKKNSPKGNG